MRRVGQWTVCALAAACGNALASALTSSLSLSLRVCVPGWLCVRYGGSAADLSGHSVDNHRVTTCRQPVGYGQPEPCLAVAQDVTETVSVLSGACPPCLGNSESWDFAETRCFGVDGWSRVRLSSADCV